MAVCYNILDQAGINARIMFKEHKQQESPEELRAEHMEEKAAAAGCTSWASACLISR